MTRYLSARHYSYFAFVALVLGLFSGWLGLSWPPAFIPALLFLLSSAALWVLALRPPLELQEVYLRIGNQLIAWADIRRVDRTGWLSPLVIKLTLYDDSRVTIIYPGELESCKSLLRALRRMSRDALIDGLPYRQYWGEQLSPGDERRHAVLPRAKILRSEDEAEVERLYHLLKTVGHLDSKTPDEK